jgi:hypothetical protein
MDAFFTMFKRSFFKFAYSVEDLRRYYVTQDDLRKHWLSIFADELIEVAKESSTKEILSILKLEFEKNPASIAKASTLQVREKVYIRTVKRGDTLRMNSHI